MKTHNKRRRARSPVRDAARRVAGPTAAVVSWGGLVTVLSQPSLPDPTVPWILPALGVLCWVLASKSRTKRLRTLITAARGNVPPVVAARPVRKRRARRWSLDG